MENAVRVMFSVAGYLLMGWLIGAGFSEHLAINLSESNFDSFWAWGWLVFWPLFLAVKFIYLFLIFIIVAAICMFSWEGGRSRGWWN